MKDWLVAVLPHGSQLSLLEFREPALLALVLIAPAIFGMARRLPARLTYSDLGLVALPARSLRLRLANLPALALALAVVCLSLIHI